MRVVPTIFKPQRVVAICVAALVAGCAAEPETLQGTRIPLRPAITADTTLASTDLDVPEAVKSRDWSGNALSDATVLHPRFGGAKFKHVWTTDIVRDRLSWPTSKPVIAKGVVYSLNGSAEIYALSLKDGKILWSRDLAPKGEKGHEGFGGGVAVQDGVAYVTNGFGDVVALDARSGQEFWRYRLDAPVRSAPAVNATRVVAVDRSGAVVALDRQTGRVAWTFQGPVGLGVVGSAAPRISGSNVIVPFPSGDLAAISLLNGQRVWQVPLARQARGTVLGAISDVTADPVVEENILITGAHFGAVAQVTPANGARNWALPDGVMSDVLAVSGTVFYVDAQARLTRREQASGTIVWQYQLPLHDIYARKNPSRNVYYGPVLAGGRVWVAGSDGHVLAFNPVKGDLRAEHRVEGGVAARPAVAGGKMVFLTMDRKVSAFQ